MKVFVNGDGNPDLYLKWNLFPEFIFYEKMDPHCFITFKICIRDCVLKLNISQ